MGSTIPLQAHAREPRVTPEQAQAERAGVQSQAHSLIEAGDPVQAGILLDREAAKWGDPVLYLDGAQAWFEAGRAEGDASMLEAGLERARIALDLLYYQLDGAADPRLRLVKGSDLPDLVTRGKETLAEGTALLEELQRAAEEPLVLEDDHGPDGFGSKGKPGRILFISGAATASAGGALVVMGVTGLAMGAVAQRRAEDPAVYGEDYDAMQQKGRRANVLAGVGLGLGLAAAGAGATLMILGRQRAKKAGDGDKLVNVAPAFDQSGGGVAVSGRF